MSNTVKAYKFTNVQSGDWYYSFDEDGEASDDPLYWHREAVTLVEQQEPVQTEPNFEQRKQILDNLDRCLHQDSKHEFLRVWIRDWTNHKLSKQTPPCKP